MTAISSRCLHRVICIYRYDEVGLIFMKMIHSVWCLIHTSSHNNLRELDVGWASVNFRLHIFYDYNFCLGLDLMVLGTDEIVMVVGKLHTIKNHIRVVNFKNIILCLFYFHLLPSKLMVFRFSIKISLKSSVKHDGENNIFRLEI